MLAGKKLLVPIDGSANSLRALAFVIKRVKKDKQLRICLLNVQPPLPRSLFVTRTMIAEFHDSKSKEALARSREILAKNHMCAEIIVRIGKVAEAIVKFAMQRHCGEIIMGTRGLGSLKGLLLGSITTKLIHLARAPVTS